MYRCDKFVKPYCLVFWVCLLVSSVAYGALCATGQALQVTIFTWTATVNYYEGRIQSIESEIGSLERDRSFTQIQISAHMATHAGCNSSCSVVNGMIADINAINYVLNLRNDDLTAAQSFRASAAAARNAAQRDLSSHIASCNLCN